MLWSSEVLLWGWLHSRRACPGSGGSPFVQPKTGQETFALGNKLICGGSLAVGLFSCRDVAQRALAKKRKGGVKMGGSSVMSREAEGRSATRWLIQQMLLK